MKTLAIIVRGKVAESHEPELLEQHADVVLSDGTPIGYFGEGAGFSANYGMFMRGVVYDYYLMKARRDSYVDAEKARESGVVSTICIFPVEDRAADAFDTFWRELLGVTAGDGGPGFSMLGNNCSTWASRALVHAGVLRGGIPGLDTPDNLFLQLKARFGSLLTCVSGYVGFTPRGNGFVVEVER